MKSFMSALGHKRTNRPGPQFAFVRYRPKAESARSPFPFYCRTIRTRWSPQAAAVTPIWA